MSANDEATTPPWTQSALPIAADAASRIPGAARAAGLALVFLAGRFRIQVTDDLGRVLGSCGPYEEEDVVAVWRRMALASGLPLLIAGPEGRLDQPYPQLGRIVLGTSIDRRRLNVLSGRRPRFLVRRKPARLPRRPLVYREREIASGRTS